MNKVVSYKTPQEFINATESFLMKKELENNIILGICYSFPEKTKEQPASVFVSFISDDEVVACSIKTGARAIVAGTAENINAIAEYYNTNNVDVTSVVGEASCSRAFAEQYHKQIGDERNLIAHELQTVNDLPLAEGELQLATESDIDVLTQWTMRFQSDARAFGKLSFEAVYEATKARINSGIMFKWMCDEQPVSIAAIVRKTKNIGIVGVVYTPKELRGKGYARTCVLKLSEHILQNGFKSCGLFTDKHNPTSNRIYHQIGYKPLNEFAEIELI